MRPYLRGAATASAVVDERNTDGIHVRIDGSQWTLGTYLDAEPLSGTAAASRR